MGNRRLVPLAVFVLLPIVHMWPLITDPGRLSRNDNADTQLKEWTLAGFGGARLSHRAGSRCSR
jgi:hypothetical protein